MPAVLQVAYLRDTPISSAIGMVFDSLPDCNDADDRRRPSAVVG